jgi:predicted NBD/HSP70 family sugar kinase
LRCFSKSGILSFLRAKAPVAGSATATLDKLAPEWRTQMIGSKARREQQGDVACLLTVVLLFVQVLKKACKSDVLVDKALKRAADALGAGVANVITTTGCDTVVVGGGLIEEIGTLWPRVLASVAQHSLAGEANKDLVKKTILGDSANAVGAAAYARKMARK